LGHDNEAVVWAAKGKSSVARVVMLDDASCSDDFDGAMEDVHVSLICFFVAHGITKVTTAVVC